MNKDKEVIMNFYIEKLIKNLVFDGFRLDLRNKSEVNFNAEDKILGFAITFYDYLDIYIRSNTRRNINRLQEQIEDVLGLKNPIKGFKEVEKHTEFWDQCKYKRDCELVYILTDEFIQKIQGLAAIQLGSDIDITLIH